MKQVNGPTFFLTDFNLGKFFLKNISKPKKFLSPNKNIFFSDDPLDIKFDFFNVMENL